MVVLDSEPDAVSAALLVQLFVMLALGSDGGAALGAAGYMRFSAQLLPAFQHLPALVWHRPGASLRRILSERYVARPMSGSPPPTSVAVDV